MEYSLDYHYTRESTLNDSNGHFESESIMENSHTRDSRRAARRIRLTWAIVMATATVVIGVVFLTKSTTANSLGILGFALLALAALQGVLLIWNDRRLQNRAGR